MQLYSSDCSVALYCYQNEQQFFFLRQNAEITDGNAVYNPKQYTTFTIFTNFTITQQGDDKCGQREKRLTYTLMLSTFFTVDIVPQYFTN
jgi:hypothetical protein